MATGSAATITGTKSYTDRYQLTEYDDILTVSGADITFLDPAGEIFLDAGNDTVTVTNSTITSNSATGGSLAFYLGSGDDTITLNNSTFNTEFYAGSGNDSILVSGSANSQVTISKKFSLGTGNDVLTLAAILTGGGNLDFGDGTDTLVFDGGSLFLTGSIANLTNLTVTGNSGTLGTDLSLSGNSVAITLGGNLTGDTNGRKITIDGSSVSLHTVNNVLTDVGYILNNAIFTQSDGGTLEFNGVSCDVISAQNSTFDLHDIVIGNATGGISLAGGTFKLIDSNLANSGHGIHANGTIVDLAGVGFSNNIYGVDLSDGKLTGTDISFTGHSDRALRAAHANMILSDIRFTRNHIFVQASASASATATATAQGGAIYQTGGDMTLTSASFSNNIAYGTAYTTLTSVNFDHAVNFATAQGGAIYQSDGDMTLTSASFSDNIAYGTAYTTATSYYTTATSVNFAHAQGGAIWRSGGDLTLTECTFSGNRATVAATAYATATENAHAGTAYATAATTAQGGAIYHTSGNMTLTSASFSNNIAKRSSRTSMRQERK